MACISSAAVIIKNRCFNITDSTPSVPYAILFNMQKLDGRNIEIALCILKTLVISMSHKAWKDKRQRPSEAFFFSKVSNYIRGNGLVSACKAERFVCCFAYKKMGTM